MPTFRLGDLAFDPGVSVEMLGGTPDALFRRHIVHRHNSIIEDP